MKSVRLATMLVSLGIAGSASAQVFQPPTNTVPFDPPVINLLPQWQCITGTGKACSLDQLQQPNAYRQVLVLPTGYNADEHAKFFTDADQFRMSASDLPGEAVYSELKRDHILYVTYWLPGGDLSNATTNTLPLPNFSAAVVQAPTRGYVLSLVTTSVDQKVDNLKETLTWLRPSATVVVYDTDMSVPATASEPNFTRRTYGIARVARNDVGSAYVPTHVLGHAMMSWLDEYVEPGFEDLNIRSLDILTPTLFLDGSWGGFISAIGNLLGVYDYNISEILASNGNDNISTSSYPSTVYSGLPQDRFVYEGGMFFGRGTFHQAGSNLMNGNNVVRGPDDTFAYAHSPAQQRVIEEAFGGTARRANDRLRNAGPLNGWPLKYGSTTTVMMFDADKNHRWHPTQQYQVRVGWYERVWYTCWSGPFPYPCYTDIWKTAQKTIAPTAMTVQLQESAAYGLASLTQNVLCGIGISTVNGSAGAIDICTQPVNDITSAFLPTFTFYMPYQTTGVPADQWFTTYWWQFRTNNGTLWSGWTPWSSFYRSF